MESECLCALIDIGCEVSIIADPREVFVDCRGRDVQDGLLAELYREKDLTHLWLEGCDISDVSILQLSANYRLEVLDIGSTRVSATVLRIVPTLFHLAGLFLRGMQGINPSIEYLVNHPSLEGIDLSFTDIAAPGLIRLLRSSRITNVDVSGTQIVPSDILPLDDLDADPCRSVHFRFSNAEGTAIVMPRPG